ncbi:DUF4926 domain-containing protein [Pleurocapsa sp. PCC 7319]|uniref:DUF4926 domain-containing protein n=1 Tax=Pleurocapsa sp. PCC 7319 TaxID=118161 RepID=UPI000346E28E|nr:DUF4926 domain-containing protein [Pleurocapsa sp. PCC 7319]
MTLKLFSEVTLTQNIDEYNLKLGDIATLIDFIPHPQGKEDGCILEVFNAVGESIAVVTVPKSTIQPLQANQILTTRPLSTTT